MKNKFILIIIISLLVFNCKKNNQKLINSDSTSSSKSSLFLKNTMFNKQLNEQDNYTAIDSFMNINSICFESNFMKIYNYDGSLGPSREFVLKNSNPVGAISKNNVQGPYGKYCSGTLISENLFLTASHCCDENLIGRYVAFNYQHKSQNKLYKQYFYKIVEIVESGKIKKLDYAILKLEGNPGKQFGIAKISTKKLLNNELLTIIQHPKGRSKEIEAGKFTRKKKNWILYEDLDTDSASSGAGVLNKKGYLVGLHVLGDCNNSGGENFAINISKVSKSSKIINQIIKNYTN